MLNWALRFNICCFLDDHNYVQHGNNFDCILAAGSIDSITAKEEHGLTELSTFHRVHQDWLFGHLSFSLQADTEGIQTSKPDSIGFPSLHFFIPQYIVRLSGNQLSIGACDGNHELVLEEISSLNISEHPKTSAIAIQSRQSKSDYINAVERLRQHILRGDCYEINYCQEFYAEQVKLDPADLFRRIQAASPAPFSAYYRLQDKYALCASPERYLQKKGPQLMSQPIKGTRKRALTSQQDEEVATALFNSEKDRAENVMVVDLVRNDMSRVCTEGSVQVEELFGIYRFPQVYQMISTITGQIDQTRFDWVDAIRATFPMGSMTGAPKHRVLELIEQYEPSARGLYSGSIGYITADGDFDFNVVIRTVLYNQSTGYLNYHAGSAITFASNAEDEYDECLLKAEFIRKLLTDSK